MSIWAKMKVQGIGACICVYVSINTMCHHCDVKTNTCCNLMLTLDWLPNALHPFKFQGQHQGVYGADRIFGDRNSPVHQLFVMVVKITMATRVNFFLLSPSHQDQSLEPLQDN